MVNLGFDYYVGCDLGQRHDYTAVALLEEPVWIPSTAGARVDPQALTPDGPYGWVPLDRVTPHQRAHWRVQAEQGGRPPDPPLALRGLWRWRGESYVTGVARIRDLLATPPLSTAHVCLVVDATGVGRGVVDLMVAAGLAPLNVTITGGDQVHADLGRSEMSCPKRELIVATQVCLQAGRLRIAAGLEHAATLADELKNYQVKLSAAGHDSYSAREGQFDDLVLAVSLSCWFRGWYCRHLDDAHRSHERSPSHVG
jgi:hypothetical protein